MTLDEGQTHKKPLLCTLYKKSIMFVIIGVAVLIIISVWYPFPSLFDNTNYGFSERLEFALGTIAGFVSLVAGWNMLVVVGAKGKFWSPWRYLAYGLLAFSLASSLNPILYVQGVKGSEYLVGIIALLYAGYPLTTLLGVREFLRASKKKLFAVSIEGILFSIAIAELTLFGLVQIYTPGVGYPAVAGIVFSLSLFINALVGLFMSTKGVGGKVRQTLNMLLLGMVVLGIAIINELYFGFLGYENELYQFLIFQFHFQRLLYLVSAVVFLYVSMRTKRDLMEMHTQFAPASESNKDEDPYIQIINAILGRFVSLVGSEITLERLEKVECIRMDENERVIGLTVPGVEAIKQLIKEYEDLLGDTAYEFAEIAARPIIAKYGYIKFPERNEM